MRTLSGLFFLAGLALVLGAAMADGGLAVFTGQANVTGNTFATGSWITLNALGDTYLKAGSANQNQGSETFVRVQNTGNNRSLVIFDSTEITDAAAGKTLNTAVLRLYVEDNGNNWGASGRAVDVHRVTTAWTELGATWNCPDDTDTGNSAPDCAVQWAGGTFTASATDSVVHTNGLLGWVEWDVTADVAAIIAAPATNSGWLVKKNDEAANGRANYTSREGAANSPELFLTFLA